MFVFVVAAAVVVGVGWGGVGSVSSVSFCK
jgi:hypothetical protein